MGRTNFRFLLKNFSSTTKVCNPARFAQQICLNMLLDRESELRKMRMEVVRLEEEEKALNLNIARLKSGCDDLENDLAIQKLYNSNLEKHMSSYRDCLLTAFNNCPLPGIRSLRA